MMHIGKVIAAFFTAVFLLVGGFLFFSGVRNENIYAALMAALVGQTFMLVLILWAFFFVKMGDMAGKVVDVLMTSDTNEARDTSASLLICVLTLDVVPGYDAAYAASVERVYRHILTVWSLPEFTVPTYARRPKDWMLARIRAWLEERQKYLEKKGQPDAKPTPA